MGGEVLLVVYQDNIYTHPKMQIKRTIGGYDSKHLAWVLFFMMYWVKANNKKIWKKNLQEKKNVQMIKKQEGMLWKQCVLMLVLQQRDTHLTFIRAPCSANLRKGPRFVCKENRAKVRLYYILFVCFFIEWGRGGGKSERRRVDELKPIMSLSVVSI